jgi:hypothetical protein
MFSSIHYLVTDKVPRTTGRELHVAFKLAYVDVFITKLRRQQAEATQDYKSSNVRNIGQGEPRHKKYQVLSHGCVKLMAVQVNKLPL